MRDLSVGNGFRLACFPVIPGREPEELTERARKVVNGAVAFGFGNLADSKLRVKQQFRRIVHPQGADNFGKTAVHVLMNQLAEVGFAEVKRLRQGSEGQRSVILLDVMEDDGKLQVTAGITLIMAQGHVCSAGSQGANQKEAHQTDGTVIGIVVRQIAFIKQFMQRPQKVGFVFCMKKNKVGAALLLQAFMEKQADQVRAGQKLSEHGLEGALPYDHCRNHPVRIR